MQADFFLSTDMVDEKIRDDFWVDISRLIYEVRGVGDHQGFSLQGSVRSRLFGNMIVGDTTFNSQICSRTPDIIRQSNLDIVLMQLIIEGDYVGDFNGANLSAQAGDIFFLDLARPLESMKKPGRRITLAIRREDLSAVIPGTNFHGLVLENKSATNRLLFEYVRGIDRTLAIMRPDEIPAIQHSMMTLIRAAAGGEPIERVRDLDVSLPMRGRIIEFIHSCIADPGLSPETIMRKFRVSHSHLYRAFEADGGVARFIRAKRLDMAFDMLARDSRKQTTLKDVRRILGVSDRSNFSGFFRERFGASPLEVRGSGRQIRHAGSVTLELHKYVSGKMSKLQGPSSKSRG